MTRKLITTDGNTAAATVAHAVNEVCAIYPITPSSPMGETADELSAAGETNIFGTIPLVSELQSEGGASGSVHGALQAGALTTTFTASQGLMLMIPNMYKIAGELTAAVFHVSARSLACQALSIFGDHSDVMAVRQTGFAMLASGSIQEIMDNALIAQAATLESRVPFLHFFDGFRSSHEINKVEELTKDDMRAMIDEELVIAHRARALTPDCPVIRGTAQNPDVYFQGRETVNKFYDACPEIVQKAMDKFAGITGRQYRLFDYVGASDAERIIVMMGSGAETAHETVNCLVEGGEKVGVLKVRLYRPFSVDAFIKAIPPTVTAMAVLDRTKEPGAAGEPLYVDVRTAVGEAMHRKITSWKDYPKIVGGRYGLSSKEFTPAMVKAVLDNLKPDDPKNHFTIGINDDVTHTSLEYDRSFSTEADDVFRGVFYGLGADGTVGANKNSIKILGEGTDNYAQGYFVYDSKKAGAVTVSHLRFSPRPIRSSYLVSQANFVACHQFPFIEKYDMLKHAMPGATFLLNSPYGPADVWDHLPREVQEDITSKKLRFHVIDAYDVAKNTGMGAHINVIMQTCFFALSGILPREQAIEQIKKAIEYTYGRKGKDVVEKNFNAVDQSLANLHEVSVPDKVTATEGRPPIVSADAPEEVKAFNARIMRGEGDDVPVSAMPVDGTFRLGTTQYEKRNIAIQIPVWESKVCVQCGMCSFVCPHATIRLKIYDEGALKGAPEGFKNAKAVGKGLEAKRATVQVAPEDCTGCGVCVTVCPGKEKDAEGNPTGRKAINMAPQLPLREGEAENWEYFLSLPETDPGLVKASTVKGSQLRRSLFEFSGACAGCGETPYVKLMSQLFGDRAIITNATGCSSIYGGNLPTTPYTTREDGRGPTWSNSLFEDNAEFGFGIRLGIDKFKEMATELLDKVECLKGQSELVGAIKTAPQTLSEEIERQRERIAQLKDILSRETDAESRRLLSVADYLVKKSVWIMGGDGWAYDIGYGGLDHVLASGRDVNVLVLNTEVYSNTGGQMSKATPRAAVAKFAAAGKPLPRKDLCLISMTYGNIYVGRVAMGANPAQTVRAFVEAESYPGPSIIVAYSHCIAHGYNMTLGLDQQKKAVATGYWPLVRFDPRLTEQGKNPLQLDSRAPSVPFEEYAYAENRYRSLKLTNPEAAERLMKLAKEDVKSRWNLYERMVKQEVFAPAGAAAEEAKEKAPQPAK
ncbi:MAG: pyruvate:ferredoxin (flavodoxin) oxidoreductase [Planctomycetota bacterium]|jgi:pyruvate-ferredoxin/flavodoxin oxidoreductase